MSDQKPMMEVAPSVPVSAVVVTSPQFGSVLLDVHALTTLFQIDQATGENPATVDSMDTLIKKCTPASLNTSGVYLLNRPTYLVTPHTDWLSRVEGRSAESQAERTLPGGQAYLVTASTPTLARDKALLAHESAWSTEEVVPISPTDLFRLLSRRTFFTEFGPDLRDALVGQKGGPFNTGMLKSDLFIPGPRSNQSLYFANTWEDWRFHLPRNWPSESLGVLRDGVEGCWARKERGSLAELSFGKFDGDTGYEPISPPIPKEEGVKVTVEGPSGGGESERIIPHLPVPKVGVCEEQGGAKTPSYASVTKSREEGELSETEEDDFRLVPGGGKKKAKKSNLGKA